MKTSYYPLGGPLVSFWADFIDRAQFPLKITAEMSGVNPKRIQQWLHRGQLRVKHVPSGTGDHRLFSFNEIGQIALLQELVDSGIPVDLAVVATGPMALAVRRHLLQLSYRTQHEIPVTKEDLLDTDEGSICIAQGEQPTIMGFDVGVPIGEIVAEMGENFTVLDARSIINRVLAAHVGKFLECMSEAHTQEMRRDAATEAQ